MNVSIGHRWPGKLLRGRLIERPNRFLTVVQLADGRRIEAHLGDRGRLVDVVFPGTEVWVANASGPARKTAFTDLIARDRNGARVCVDPAGANRLARALIERRALSWLPAWRSLTPEIREGHSRFDFAVAFRPRPVSGGVDPPAGLRSPSARCALRSRSDQRMLIEVKSVGVAEDGCGLFPDAPSERASRHALALADHVRAGGRAAILFVGQRGDIARIRPHPVDPDFALALKEARAAGVLVRGVAFEVTPRGFTYLGPRPVYR